ncbi:MAG: membrane integrity-associated transporter subunit PqiC [Desulfurivibrio sp.]|nr:MAG: membrane integrity-associated transporter subunit PqiC [Desulfurivibrio sp.]
MRLPALLGLAAIAAAACSAASHQVTYYSLLATNAAPLVAAQQRELVLSVGPVVIPDVLKKSQIATGGTDGRYQLSSSHRWVGDVDRELARAVAEQLAARLGTEQVAVFPWDQHLQPNFRVLLDVLAMGGEPGKEARLSVRWSLVDPQGKMAPVIRRSDLSETPADAGFGAWVNAQQRNISRLSEEIAAAIKETGRP